MKDFAAALHVAVGVQDVAAMRASVVGLRAIHDRGLANIDGNASLRWRLPNRG